MENIFSRIITTATALDQKWIIRIILKTPHLGIAVKNILGAYHANANAIFERTSHLSRVCEIIESGKADELEDSETITLFQPLRSMLCDRAKLSGIEALLHQQNFYVELKMDGERFQVHKKGLDYRYFSRNDEFTTSFGERATGLCFSASLHSQLHSSVQSVILDGEMMVWDEVEERFRVKGEAVEARNLKNHPNLRPVYCAFDVLFLNGDSLIQKPYEERIRLLNKLIVVDKNIVVICQRERVNTAADVLKVFNRAIDDNEEGIILKGQDSVYKPGMRGGSGWFKLKADYIDGLVSDLDLIVMGGSRNKKGYIESFILGVAVKSSDKLSGDPDENLIFHSVSSVRSGLTRPEWVNLNLSLNKHWVRNDPPPEYLDFGNCRPDSWIEPRNSIILQVKSTELQETTSYRTTHTLRFPRITCLRPDKPWFDCCPLEEFQRLTHGSPGKVQKMAKRHLTDQDVSMAKRAKPLPRRSILRNPEPLFEGEIELIDEVCRGREFCVLSTKKGQPSIRALSHMIQRHGGVIVQNPGQTTFLCVAGDLIATVKSYAKTQLYDIVTAEWLARSLGGERPLTALPAMKPFDMISMRTETRERFRKDFDSNNDSFVDDIRDEEELKRIFESMELLPYQRLLEREVVDFEDEHLGESPRLVWSLFSNICGFFCDGDEKGQELGRFLLASGRGIIVEDIEEATHAFTVDEARPVEGLPKNCQLLPVNYIVKCMMEGRLVDETPASGEGNK